MHITNTKKCYINGNYDARVNKLSCSLQQFRSTGVLKHKYRTAPHTTTQQLRTKVPFDKAAPFKSSCLALLRNFSLDYILALYLMEINLGIVKDTS